jgi:Ca2+-binding RTX toxin-like protein
MRNRTRIGSLAVVVLGCAALVALYAPSAHAALVCTMTGTNDPEFIEGTPGNDVICGLGGDDTIRGHEGNDILVGGTGQDLLQGQDGNDQLLGGPDIDFLEGNAGTGDTADFRCCNPTQGVEADLSQGFATNDGFGFIEFIDTVERVLGASSFPNTLTGDDGNNTLYGGSAVDTLTGAGGNDVLVGDAESDTLDGGPGGGDTANFRTASEGVTADLSTGAVTDDGHGFAETVTRIENLTGAQSQPNTLTGNQAANQLSGGLADDTLSGGDNKDQIDGYAGQDELNGDEGNDTLRPGTGVNDVFGGNGSDRVSYAHYGGGVGVTVSLGLDGEGGTTGPVTDSLSSIESATGTAFADNLFVQEIGTASIVRALGGDDDINVNDGDILDTADGGPGSDSSTSDLGDTIINVP